MRHLWKLKMTVTCAEFYIYLMTKGGSVYIMTNKLKTTLYIGVTADLQIRVRQHKKHNLKSFQIKYNLEYCVYYKNFFQLRSYIRKANKEMEQVKKENYTKS